MRSPEKAGRLPPAAEIFPADVTDSASLEPALTGVDYVIHAAASMHGSFGEQMEVNAAGTATLGQACLAAGVKRLVHISSIAVYGFDLKGDITEDTPVAPSGLDYSRSKAAAEEAVRGAEARGLSISIVRPGGIFGPEAGLWTAGFFMRSRRKPVLFVGKGGGRMPVVFVADVVDLAYLVAEHPAADGEAFNCVIDPPPTIRQYHAAYSELVGHRSWLGLPMPLAKAAARLLTPFAKQGTYLKEAPLMLRFIDDYGRYRMDKAADLLGWRPGYDLARGVEASVPWLRRRGLLE